MFHGRAGSGKHRICCRGEAYVLLGEIIENRGTTMDFMFEDDVDEVGSDVEAYCPKCKADTTHVVISKYEDEIRRVQCNPCGDVHSFRKPRGEAEEDMPEPVAARKRALLKKQTWEEFFAKHGERNAKPYEFRDTYRENAIVFHPKFGKGYVSEVVSESKVEITFSDARRILVHNRKGHSWLARGQGGRRPAFHGGSGEGGCQGPGEGRREEDSRQGGRQASRAT
jgi:Zn ribbon nucleic-acid-binding protein